MSATIRPLFVPSRRCVFGGQTSLENHRIAIIGLGLMGASLGKACRQRGAVRQIIGVARRRETISQAEAAGIIDCGTTDMVAGTAQADIVVLAAPVRTILQQIKVLPDNVRHPCLVLDIGSTKSQIVTAMNDLPEYIQAVGTHPMCGKETRGLEHADADLYVGAPWALVPLARTTQDSLLLAQQLAIAVGAQPIVMDAARHDRLVAAISHLPYALATTLVRTAAEVGESDAMMWQLASSGYRDTSRVAASDVTMMLDILLTNPEAIGDLVRRAVSNLSQLAALLDGGNEAALREWLSSARETKLHT